MALLEINNLSLSFSGLRAAKPDSTFAGYWDFFEKRRDGREAWEAYTPYEMRTIGAFVRLGQRDRATAALDWFMTQRQPAGWQQWPEVVRRDARSPNFLGDLPHTWVGSDFARSVLDLFAYERESDSSLVIGAGIPEVWLDDPQGVSIANLRTAYGPLSYRMARDGSGIVVTIEAGSRIPPGGIGVTPPLMRVGHGNPLACARTLDGRPLQDVTSTIRVTRLPATMRWAPATMPQSKKK